MNKTFKEFDDRRKYLETLDKKILVGMILMGMSNKCLDPKTIVKYLKKIYNQKSQ